MDLFDRRDEERKRKKPGWNLSQASALRTQALYIHVSYWGSKWDQTISWSILKKKQSADESIMKIIMSGSPYPYLVPWSWTCRFVRTRLR